MADVYRKLAEHVGVKFDKKEEESGGSTDMGNVSQIVPSIHPVFGIETTAVNHSKEFAAAASMILIKKGSSLIHRTNINKN